MKPALRMRFRTILTQTTPIGVFTISAIEFIYRYRLLWLLTLILSVAAAVVLLIFLPRKYASEAKLLVKIGRESVTLDPTATTSQTMVMQQTQEEEINSALEVVYGRRVKEAVVEKLGVQQILSGKLDNDPDSPEKPEASKFSLGSALGSLGDFLLEIGVRDPVSDYDRAILKLEDSTYAYASKKSRVISIFTEAPTPEMAQAIANAVSEAYIYEHMRISQTEGSYEFFESEANQTAAKLEQAKLEMAEFMSERQIVSVDSNEELLKNAWNDILANILRLENLEKELGARFSTRHPERVIVMEQLASARRALNRLKQAETIEGGARSSTTALANYEEDNDRRGKNPGSSVLKFRGNPMTDSDMVSRIETLILSNNELERLHQRVETLESQLGLHRGKLEEARLIKEQKEKSISNITAFQPATLNRKPTAPNKGLVGVGTIFLGLSLATALAMFRDMTFRRKRLFNVTDVERALKLPVVAKLSSDRSGAQKTLKKKRALRQLRDECGDVVHRFVQFGHKKQQPNKKGIVVGVLSFDSGNGGSTVAAALATSCADDYGIDTVLVDADRKSRSVTQRFSLNGSPGLYELIRDDMEVEKCFQKSSLFDLTLVSSTNKTKSNAALGALSASDVLKQLSNLREHFEVVIVDLPPATSSDSLVSMAPLMDHILLVAEAGGTRSESAVNVLRKFDDSDTEILGVILNKCRSEFPWQRKV